MKVISGSSNKPLAQDIAYHLGTSLSAVDTMIFPDGERRIRIVESMVEEHVVIVQSTTTPVDENYMELFFLIDSARRSGAAQVSIIMPYIGYQRQDHIFRDGEAVSLEVIIKLLQSLDIDSLISVDMHTSRIPELFPSKIAVSHLSALPLFAEKIKQENWNNTSTILISPDMGGIRRIKMLSQLLDNMPYAAIEKNRDLTTGSLNESKLGEGTITNQTSAIIVDDMIASGKTILEASHLVKKLGIKKVFVFATHAIFTKESENTLKKADIEKIYITDSVHVLHIKQFPNMETISIAPLLAKEIQKMV